MKQSLLIACLSLVLLACAPTVRRVAGTVSNTISGTSSIHYAAEPWELISALATLAPTLEPSIAHTPYRIEELTNTSLSLIATPLSGSTVFRSNEKPVKITLEIKAEALEGHSLLTLIPDPSDVTARGAKDALIAKLDEQFERWSGG
jgi:hypothetical protein